MQSNEILFFVVVVLHVTGIVGIILYVFIEHARTVSKREAFYEQYRKYKREREMAFSIDQRSKNRRF